jgi:FkbM family methyltransferase
VICSVNVAAAMSPKRPLVWLAVKPALERGLSLLPARWQYHVKRLYASRALAREPEPQEFAVLRHLIEDGQSVIDAGANYGIYTKFFSHYASGQVIGIEPIPSTFDILLNNVKALSLQNVRLFQCALSDRPGMVTMEIPEDDRGRAVHYLARIKYSDASRPPVGTSCSVTARTLDAITGETGLTIGLIKCDVEMHEFEVLSGALTLLRRDAPAIYVEIQPDFKTKKSQRPEIINLLAAEGYVPYVCKGGSVVRWTPNHMNALDLLFLTRKHCQRLVQCGVAVSEG